MQLGIHLPHAGSKATPALIRRYAVRAEALGFADVWVSEHIIVPRGKFPRSPLFYDPVLTLTYVAAVTERVRLGTSVLVLPMRHPLPLAKELATLQNLSNGRLLLGAGVGWLEEEYTALGVPFRERGRRMDEGIAIMRDVWAKDPVDLHGKFVAADGKGLTMLPQPVKPIPLWLCGSADAAIERTIRLAEGWHGSQQTPEETAALAKRLRAARPTGFTISMRVGWNGKDAGALRDKIAAYEAVGVQHIMVAPADREVDDWDEVIEGAGRFVRG